MHLFFLFFIALPSLAQEQSPVSLATTAPIYKVQVVQRSNNGDTYRIGDRIALYIEIPQDVQNQNSGFELRPETDEKQLGETGWYLDKQVNLFSGNLRFVVSPVQVGNLTLPSLILQNQAKETIGKTEPWSVKVVGENLTPEEQNKKPEYLPVTEMSLSAKIWLFLLVVLAVVSAAVFYVYRRWRSKLQPTKPAAPAPITPIDPYDVIALKALQDLYQRNPYRQDTWKPIAFGVSEILKFFFSSRLGIDARESTTSEMLALLEKIGWSKPEIQEVATLFQDLDLIKFTKKENYDHFDEVQYLEFKSKAEALIRRWALPKSQGAI